MDLTAQLDKALRENADLRAKLEAATKNDERYRWLRDESPKSSDSWTLGVYPADENCQVAGEELDAAIDAAIAQGKGEK